ncbi:MAG TPA: ferritin-like domain-containing protein [Thermomicrobiales bacterium]|jgi:hypothetical protein
MALTSILTTGLSRQYSRRGVLQGGVALGAGAVALSALGIPALGFGGAVGAAAAGPLDSDVEILNYALTLEYLEAAAYKAINDAGVLSGRAASYFKAFGAHEQAHVDALIATIPKLGGTPVAMPTFNFSSVPTSAAEIVKFFQMVEAVGVSAYLGAAASIKNFDVLEAALSIHAVEAEHAAALADLVAPGTNLFSPSPFETPRTPAEVLQIVGPFLAAAPAPQPMPGLPNTGGGFAAGGADLLNRELSRAR